MDAQVAELAKALVSLKKDHKISGNVVGGYDCKCGASWDWQRHEKEAADLHVAVEQAKELIAAGFGKL